MNIVIKDKVDTPINAYIVECEAMFGDADGYSTVTKGSFKKDKDEEYLLDLLNTCNEMMKVSRRKIDEIEGFNKWFDVDRLTELEYEELPDIMKDTADYWLRDPQSHGEYYAALTGYEVFYYDENGIKFNVEVS